MADITTNQQPATADAIATFERTCGQALPPDYRDFLQRYNGGRPTPNAFEIGGGLGDGGVRSFYGLHDGDYSLAAAFTSTRGRMPQHLLPIAEDDCGNRICLSLAEHDCGAVFFWDHETEADESEPADDRNLYRVASSFTAFLAALRAAPPVELQPGQVLSTWIDPEFLRQLKEKGEA